MIITVSGKPCSGKSTMAEIFVKKYGFERIYAGAIFKEKAKEIGLNTLELCASKDVYALDYAVDDELKKIYETRLNENILIESRTSWSFMPKAFNVFIDVDDKTIAERLYNSDRVNKEKPSSLKEAKKVVKKRYKVDCKRYKKLYKINCNDFKNYDFVIDNSHLSPEETADAIYLAYQKYLHSLNK